MNKKPWWKAGIKAEGVACPCCDSTIEILPLDTHLYMGFGGWGIYKNSELYFVEDEHDEWEKIKTLSDIEKMIGDNNDDEFVAWLETPLREAKYQRHSKNNWVLIETGPGFA